MPADVTRRPWLALQVTLATQVLASLVMSAAPVLAPAVAPQLGVAPERVGVFMGNSRSDTGDDYRPQNGREV